jgi:uncharacterized membrane protein
MVSGIALITGLVFWVIDNEAGFFVFLVMLLLIGFSCFGMARSSLAKLQTKH